MSETNLEHYKRELGKIFYQGCPNPAAMFDKIKKNYDSNIRSSYGQTYADDILDWMAQPYKEKILKEDERKYLACVIEPFKDKVKYISKIGMEQFISIVTVDGCSCCLPYFTCKKYEGMTSYREYMLEELGL